MPEIEQLSPIHIFQKFERMVAKTDVYPLTVDNVNIQHDAFGRLGDTDSDIAGTGEPFATVELAKKESDYALRFVLMFADIGFLFDIEGWGQLEFAYDDAGDTNNAVAKAIFATAAMLSNGQIFIMHTAQNGRVCAAEIIYREKAVSELVLLAIQGNYPKFIKSGSVDEYDVHVMKNEYHTPSFALKDCNLLRAKKADGKPLAIPRVYENKLLTPLTKKSYGELMGVVGNDLAGVTDDKEFENKLFYSPDYWVIGFAISTAVYFLLLRQFHLPLFLAGLIGFPASGYLTAKLMLYKEELKLTDRKTWLTHASDLVAKIFQLPYFFAAGLFGVVVSTSFPIYVLKGSGELVNLHDLAEATTESVAIIFFVLVAALALSIYKNRITQAISAVLGLVSVGALIAANSLTDTSEKIATPEPQTTVTLLLYCYVVILAVTILIKLVKTILRPQK